MPCHQKTAWKISWRYHVDDNFNNSQHFEHLLFAGIQAISKVAWLIVILIKFPQWSEVATYSSSVGCFMTQFAFWQQVWMLFPSRTFAKNLKCASGQALLQQRAVSERPLRRPAPPPG